VLQNDQWIDKHKIFVPYAIGSGDSKTDQVKPLYGEPGSCCSETYLVFGPLSSKKKVDNVISYINTRFFHFFLTLRKNTQHATRTAYEFVPLQNFDEPWTDEKLFKKYRLTGKEIEFIKTTVRPMGLDNE
jgi:site-specific DNA-methyltransferase (adenine-specific)